MDGERWSRSSHFASKPFKKTSTLGSASWCRALAAPRLYRLHLPNLLIIPDAASFDSIAWNLASQGRYAMPDHPENTVNPGITRPTTYRPPSYVLFMAALYKIAGHRFRAVRVAQAFMGLGLIGLLICTAGELQWGARAQWAAAVLTTFYPFFIYYESHLLSDAYLTFWHMASLLAALRWHHKPSSVGRAALFAFCFAVLGLLKGIFMPLFVVVMAGQTVLCWRARGRRVPLDIAFRDRRRGVCSAAGGGGDCATTSPSAAFSSTVTAAAR